jgi:hypothetical protein
LLAVKSTMDVVWVLAIKFVTTAQLARLVERWMVYGRPPPIQFLRKRLFNRIAFFAHDRPR